MSPDPPTHWQDVYRKRASTDVSWYEPVPERSLELIEATGLGPGDPIIDVGGGASTLVDHLLDRGHRDLTVLDLAPESLTAARDRLGPRGEAVRWIAGDVLAFRPSRRYALWHDRAVFHFLVAPDDRARYLATLDAALAPDGHVVLATFGPHGPTSCSGLPVERYSADALGRVLGPRFALERSLLHTHRTPAGRPQEFLHGWWRARG